MFHAKIRLSYLLICICHIISGTYEYDVTVAGSIAFADGIGRHAVVFIDMLKKDLSVQVISSSYSAPHCQDTKLEMLAQSDKFRL